MGRIEARMKELGIALPAKGLVPKANALLWKKSGNQVHLAGQGPAWDGEIVMTGRLGADMSTADGQKAARLCALNLLFHLRLACGGDLDKVTSCVMVQAYVRGTDDFAEQPLVVNGASDLFVQIFGDAGRHARTAVGVNGLPRDMPVEVQAIFEVAG